MRQPTLLRMACLLSMAATGRLQAQVADEAPVTVETIEVVGSNIRDVDPEGVSPVLVLDRPYIEQSGVITVGELIEQLPMNNAGGFNDRDALSSSPGGTGISFRGLGPNAVLVLVNGRPSASYAFPYVTEFGSLVSFVDMNNIPLAAVERIEVLKDGASAIYGSQAMAGVINIVLRDSTRGLSLELRRGSAAGDGAEETSFNLLSGLNLPKTKVQFILSHTNREQLAWSDRSISASADTEAFGGIDGRSQLAGNFFNFGGLFNGGGAYGTLGGECEERNQFASAPAYSEDPESGICLFDPNTQIVVPSAKRSGLTVLANRELTPKLELSIEANVLSGDGEARLDPEPWGGRNLSRGQSLEPDRQ